MLMAENAAEKLARDIREDIARGVLSPGLQMTPPSLAHQFGVSTAPVREALALLHAEGLLDHDAHRGFSVPKLSTDEARQLFRWRSVVEIELLTSIRAPAEAELRRLGAALDTISDTGNSDWRDGVAAFRDFHHCLFSLSDRDRIVREAMRLWALTDRYRWMLPTPPVDLVSRMVADMRDVVAALADGDRPTVLAFVTDGLAMYRAIVEERLQERCV